MSLRRLGYTGLRFDPPDLGALLASPVGAERIGVATGGNVQQALNSAATSAALAATTGAALVGTIAAGAGAVSRTVQSKLRDGVSVKDFGALGNNAANDTAAFIAAIAAVVATSPSGGGQVTVPIGVYLINQVVIPANITLAIDKNAIILPFSSTGSLFLITGGLSGIIGGKLENRSNFATQAIIITKPANNLRIDLNVFFMAGFAIGVLSNTGDCIHVYGTTTINVGVLVQSQDDFRNCSIRHNYTLGGALARLRVLTQGAEGVSIHGNIVLPATGNAYCVRLECGLEIDIFDNIFDQVITGEAVQLVGGAVELAAIKIHNNWMGRQFNVLHVNANYGIFATGLIRGLYIHNNTTTGWQQAGIYIQGTTPGAISAVSIRSNHSYVGDRNLRDIQLENVTNVSISDEMFNGSGASIVEGANVFGTVTGCQFAASVIPSITLNLRYGQQLSGMTVTNKGSVSVPSAAAVTVTHGLTGVPAAQNILLSLGSNPPTAPGALWVDTFTGTTFNINAKVSPGGATTVGWQADIAR